MSRVSSALDVLDRWCAQRARAEARSPVEVKLASGSLTDARQSTRGGVPVGRFQALLSSWSVDLDGDVFRRGAWALSIADHKDRGNRPVRMFFNHQANEPIGAWPVESLVETSRGLEAVGELNLETRAGSEAWSLVRANQVSDVSVGFVPIKTRPGSSSSGFQREILSAALVEASLVTEPAQRDARVLAVLKARSREQDQIANILADLNAMKEML